MKKKKTIWIILVVLIFFILFVTFKWNDVQEYLALRKSIIWTPNVELKVSDFQFDPDQNYIDNFSARVGIVNVHRITDSIVLRSTTVFLPENSYVSDTSDANFIRIAQARFDLCEVYRRKLVSKIINLNKGNIKSITLDSIVKYENLFYESFETEWDKFNELSKNERMKGLVEMENYIQQELK
ncbi:hypothetical protein UMM65_10645 [Aureibaculum sp. 2210JD6-5]|uniref:hypothetical protein n=1 Tax=Aureibaculum sp. 2210JD6-5 TaxID=3103957 RepID=UPI002AAD113F|nr:hypothetical protein [Aureibaculum sp. 2210JD6-5]MDY7395702.1 hypothetical protein [Aureibaculum sp. 2210JD6-5]